MNILRFVALLLTCARLGSAPSTAAKVLVTPEDFPAAQRVIQIINGSSGPPPIAGESRFTLADSEFVVERLATDRTGRLVLKARDRASLDATATKAAWDLVSRLNVATWKPSYRAQTLDGAHWSVSVRINGVETTSNGVNAYPPRPDGKLIGFENGQPVGDSYHILISFFGALAQKK